MGSGPISDHKVLEGEPPLWCVCQDSQAQVCATWLHEPHDYFCGRLSSAALRWPRAQENIGLPGL